jgi:heptosyltransferase II
MKTVRILIVKHGALGDVVRTSYFAGALKRKYGEQLELSWVTSPAALPLLADNPHVDRVSVSFSDFQGDAFDVVYSLDDEGPVLEAVSKLRAQTISGALLHEGKPSYSPDAAEWFDMGLLSKFGKARADQLKRLNTRGHAEIFQRIFQVDAVRPEFFLSRDGKAAAAGFLPGRASLVGINPYAGGRWPSKEVRDDELYSLLKAIGEQRVFPQPVTVVLFGAGEDRRRNESLAARVAAARISQEIVVADTDASLMTLAGYISRMDLMISSDSLAMHLAIAQGIPTVVFFAPTSAVEIDDFGRCEKVISLAPDYCSYAKDCDNSTITADRLIDTIRASSLNRFERQVARNS